MYESFYHLREKPFTLLPDPGFLYMSDKHSMALTLLEYSLMNHTGFTVISGEIGAGKTTLIRHILNQMERDHTVGLISTTHRSFGELLQWILLAFSLEHANMSKVEMYQRFVDFIIGEYAQNRSVVLIVDEAQNMPAEVLEELRMLSNINADKDQALQVILVGQRELRETLQRPELAQFAQRISVDFHLQPLSEDETAAYIRHRLQVAGGDPDIFDRAACRAIYRYSNGVPRLINVLCDTALVYGYAEQLQRIGEKLVTAVAYEKQQGGIFPTFEKAVKEVEPAVAQPIEDDEAYRFEPATELTEPKADVTGTAAPIKEQTVFADEQSGYEPAEFAAPPDTPSATGSEDSQPGIAAYRLTDTETVTAIYKPPGFSTSLHTTSDTRSDDSQPGMDAHSNTDSKPAAAEAHGDDQAPHTEDEQASKKVRLALCSAHDGFRIYLVRQLKSYGINVVMSAPLYEENLMAMDPADFDVLLIDRDEYSVTQSPDLEDILARWRGPLLYNDTQAMKAALREGNYSFGKALARQIETLADASRARTGT